MYEMKEEINTISDSSELHSKVQGPLQLIVNEDSTVEICDPEVGEYYGVYMGGSIRFYNSAIEDDSHILSYPLEKIEDIREGRSKEIIVTLTDGKVNIHKASFKVAPEMPDIQVIDYSHPSVNGLAKILRKVHPDIDMYFYYDEIQDKLMSDLSLVGVNRIEPLQGLQNNYALFALRSELENESRQVTRKGLTYTEYLRVNKSDLLDVLYMIAVKNKRNPFMELIRRSEWDGVKRIQTFLYESGYRTSGLKPEEEEEYLNAVLMAFLLSIIERNMEANYPSIPFVPIIIGEQGAGKSSLLRVLGFNTFCKPTTVSFENTKKFYESVQGAVIVELLEATQLQDRNNEQVKAFIDATDYAYRKSYAAESSSRRVLYNLAITTNNYLLLSDLTGNRRFFPLYISKETVQIMPHNREEYEIMQLWAEALYNYKQGRRWMDYLYEDKELCVLKPIFSLMQDNVTDTVGAPELLKDYLDTHFPNVGDAVNHYEIKDYLRDQGGYYGRDLTEALKIFMKSPSTFGFGKPVEKSKYFSDLGSSRKVKEYRRTKPILVNTEEKLCDVELVLV